MPTAMLPSSARHADRLMWLLCIVLMVTTGCGRSFRRPVPQDLSARARIPGLSEIRTWSDQRSAAFEASILRSLTQRRDWYAGHPEQEVPATVDILALSSGGDKGAFGAGLLCGWTDSGSRPEFRLVTGVSTGALTAPFAFVGPEYDDQLREAYTSVSQRDIFRVRPFFGLFYGDSLTDTGPLWRLVNKYYDQALLDAVAREHARGRRLFVATTNLDAQRGVTWDMGAIASSGHPEALKLFREILVASASIPVVFPPVYIEVEADGKRYDEMHVDGATMAEVFLYGFAFDLRQAQLKNGETPSAHPIRAFIIRNSRLHPVYEAVEPRLPTIGTRAIMSLLKSQSIGDLYRIFAITQRDGIDFNLASIPPSFEMKPEEPFDPRFMKALFQCGFEVGRKGGAWAEFPPGYNAALGRD